MGSLPPNKSHTQVTKTGAVRGLEKGNGQAEPMPLPVVEGSLERSFRKKPIRRCSQGGCGRTNHGWVVTIFM